MMILNRMISVGCIKKVTVEERLKEVREFIIWIDGGRMFQKEEEASPPVKASSQMVLN